MEVELFYICIYINMLLEGRGSYLVNNILCDLLGRFFGF